jgi:hypothetical protein
MVFHFDIKILKYTQKQKHKTLLVIELYCLRDLAMSVKFPSFESNFFLSRKTFLIGRYKCHYSEPQNKPGRFF